jgi:hypothetical protein
MSFAPTLERALTALSADYTDQLNVLLDEGREDLAGQLADEFERRSLDLLLAQPA